MRPRTNCIFAVEDEVEVFFEHAPEVAGPREVTVVFTVPSERLNI